MPFSPKNLSVLAHVQANGFTLWHYLCPDDISESALAFYFNGAETTFRSGDIVMMTYVPAGAPAGAWSVVVTVTDSGVTAVRMP